MNVDLRAFDYALEPVRRQRQWQMDALQARLGQVQRELQEAEERLEDLRGQQRAQCQRAARALAERLDPCIYPRLLQWLAELRRTIQSAEEVLIELRTQRKEIMTRCQVQRQKVDAIEQHREDCLSEFVKDEQARQSKEADRDWLSQHARTRNGFADDAEAESTEEQP